MTIHPLQELEALRAELAECRWLLREYQYDDDGRCNFCGQPLDCTPDCAWKKAMGEA